MTIKPLGLNSTEVTLNLITVLYSYDTPVAIRSHLDMSVFVTNKFHSKTTSRHINNWSSGYKVHYVSQAKIDQACSTETISPLL